jgi:hypothetical protein
MQSMHSERVRQALLDIAENIYRHENDTVAQDYVWRTVHEGLPLLIAAVEQELRDG